MQKGKKSKRARDSAYPMDTELRRSRFAGRAPICAPPAKALPVLCGSATAASAHIKHNQREHKRKKEKRMRQERVSHLKLKKGEKLSERVEVESPKMQSIMKRENKTRERNRDETRIRRR